MIYPPGGPKVSRDGFDALEIEYEGKFGPFPKKAYVKLSTRFRVEKGYLNIPRSEEILEYSLQQPLRWNSTRFTVI